jgi:hypothetical protein
MVGFKQLIKTVLDLRARLDLVEKTIKSMERLQQMEFGDLPESKPIGPASHSSADAVAEKRVA